jgi:hypothetical protein
MIEWSSTMSAMVARETIKERIERARDPRVSGRRR